MTMPGQFSLCPTNPGNGEAIELRRRPRIVPLSVIVPPLH